MKLWRVVLMLVSILWQRTAARDHGQVTCYADEPARYSLTLHTFWSSDRFPKQYPRYRPNAQWSKLIGRSHDGEYRLWSVDAIAKPTVKQFVQNGVSKGLDDEAQGYHGILDTFYAPSIPLGVGNASVQFNVDSKHSKISVMSRLIPSPDWFVGLDSVDLCDVHTWRAFINVDLDPMDAGTDRGFTFTSPNWEERPQRPISGISASFPSHPAGSFHYGDKVTLPTIARIVIKRMTEDDISSSSEESSGDDSEERKESAMFLDTSFEKDLYLKRERIRPTEILHEPEKSQVIKNEARNIKDSHRKDKSSSGGKLLIGRYNVNKDNTKRRIPVFKLSRNPKKSKFNRRKESRNKTDHTTDCLVSEWSKFTECSKTCGYGVRVRTRYVTRERGSRGAHCPPLQQQETCGTMKGCGWNHFSFLQNDSEN